MSNPTIYECYEFLCDFRASHGYTATVDFIDKEWKPHWRSGVIHALRKYGYLDVAAYLNLAGVKDGRDVLKITQAGHTFLETFRPEYHDWVRRGRDGTLGSILASALEETSADRLRREAQEPVDFKVDLRPAQKEFLAKRLAAQKAADENKAFYSNNALFGAI